jgi:hypothetical protein
VNGLTGAAGGDRAEIEQVIKTKGVDGALTVPMRLSDACGHYMVEVAGGSGARREFLRCGLCASTVIQRGENAGRVVTYTNVVRAIDKLGDWIGVTAAFDMPEGQPTRRPERPGAILARAKTKGL